MRWLLATLLLLPGLAFSGGAAACELSDDTDYLTVVERATKLEKPYVLAFIGTDWSLDSLKLDREVFDQPTFAGNEKYDFFLCKVHFYQTQERPPEILRQNQDLAEKFGVEEFPTIIVLSHDGKELGRLGYVEGGVEKFGAVVNDLIARGSAER
jgi:thioredoxin-related protein